MSNTDSVNDVIEHFKPQATDIITEMINEKYTDCRLLDPDQAAELCADVFEKCVWDIANNAFHDGYEKAKQELIDRLKRRAGR